MTSYRYDPALVEHLHRRATGAVAGLRALRCDDHAAWEALGVAASLRRHLEDDWLPLLASIRASTAMVSWRSAAPDDVAAWGLGGIVRRSGHGWAAATGLEGVASRDLIDGLVAALDGFDRAASRGEGDAGAAWRRLTTHLTELARRLDSDPRVAGVAWHVLGRDGVHEMLSAYSRATELSRLGFLDTDVARSESTLAVVLGALARHDTGAADAIRSDATASGAVAAVLAAAPERFTPALLVAVATDLLASARAGTAVTPDRAAELRTATGLAMRALLTLPIAELDAVLDDEALREIATSEILGDDDVEAVVIAALAGRGADDDALLAGLARLAVLTDVAAQSTLNPGARRGVALGIGAYLRHIATQLAGDAETHLVVAVGDRTVEFGRREGIEALLGQLVEDEHAQVALGVAVSDLRARALREAAQTLTSSPSDLDTDTATKAFIGPLSEVEVVVRAVHEGITRLEDEHAFQHGLAVGRATGVIDAVTTVASLITPATPLVRLATTAGSKLVTGAVRATEPAAVDGAALLQQQERATYLAIVDLPLDEPHLRDRLGLGLVDSSTWQALSAKRDELDAASTAEERRTIVAELRELVRNDPWLHGYVTVIGNVAA